MTIIANPPYDGNLHLKILNKIIEEFPDAEIVNLSPIRWLQDPLAEYKKASDFKRFPKIRERIESLEEMNKSEVFKTFYIANSSDFGIYHLTKKGGAKLEERLLCKKCYNKIADKLCNIEKNKKDGWRVRINIINNSNHRKGGLNTLGKLLYFYDGMKDGKPWYTFYQKNKWSKSTPEITYSIKFATENEAKNFISAIEDTKFGRYYTHEIITDSSVSNKNILWLGDYTKKWDDAALREYFSITDEEWHEIESAFEVD